MTEGSSGKIRYRGRISQIRVYLTKFLRMFVYQSDWKVLPFGALIAALVTFVAGANMFVTQEGTTSGTFALTCVCIWNGFFNSIQVVCREREIIKKEHRTGMYISSYILSHMLYQLILCFLQTIITILICVIAGVQIPAEGIVTSSGVVDMGITILLVTYTADIMALMVSCIVKTTTSAMTVMPFLLIYQLLFSGGMFELGAADFLKVTTISHWGMDILCTIGRFNEQPMVTLWNTMVQFKDITIKGRQPVQEVLIQAEQSGTVNDILAWSGQHNANPAYESVISNVLPGWGALIFMMIIFALVSVAALSLIDRDKRD
ncbi:MAG: ABC transporter permease [Lachnospiraceae bacterium]|nr:ABC transporter permease [Lachnospiraceae bacterium]